MFKKLLQKRCALKSAISNPHLCDICILVEATQSKNHFIQSKAENNLIQILPRIQASDGDLLSGRQRFYLYQYLKVNSPRPDLALAILEAMAYIGDYTASPYIEQLANACPCSRQQERIVFLCQCWLPKLRLKCANAKAQETLLRASDVP